MLEAPGAALPRVAAALSGRDDGGGTAGARLARAPAGDAETAPSGLRDALLLRGAADRLRPETARALYGGLRTASVSRLESFAACPFAHFLRLRPQAGDRRALRAHPPRRGRVLPRRRARLSGRGDGRTATSTPTAPDARMERVAETLLAPLREGPLGQSARTRAEERRLKNVARTAARLLTEQLCRHAVPPRGAGGALRPRRRRAPVCAWARAENVRALRLHRPRGPLGGGKALRARCSTTSAARRPFDLAEAYAGLQLQLLVYLAAAAKRRGALAAGAFYFRMDEGYVLTPETDPAAVAEASAQGAAHGRADGGRRGRLRGQFRRAQALLQGRARPLRARG